jgi:hypothetical protein
MVLNGGGGGGTVGPGTPNTISKFITPTTIGDSNITDNGTAVTVGVPLTATSFKTPTGGPDQILAADGSIIIAGANITISGGVISANVAGGGGDKNYVHNQGLAAAVWNVTHNLGKLPSVTVINSAGEEVVGEVNHTDNNSLTITFAGGFSGVATMN